MSQNGQTHFKNLAEFAARLLKYVWPFWDIMHWWVKSGPGQSVGCKVSFDFQCFFYRKNMNENKVQWKTKLSKTVIEIDIWKQESVIKCYWAVRNNLLFQE